MNLSPSGGPRLLDKRTMTMIRERGRESRGERGRKRERGEKGERRRYIILSYVPKRYLIGDTLSPSIL
jgi:hypothetical protein